MADAAFEDLPPSRQVAKNAKRIRGYDGDFKHRGSVQVHLMTPIGDIRTTGEIPI
jgi:hypothetical protein